MMITDNIMSDLLDFDVPWKPLVTNEEISSTALDSAYYLQSSNKLASKLLMDISGQQALTSEKRTQIASVIYALYNDNWTKRFNVYNAEYEPLSNYDMTETETLDEDVSNESRHTGTVSDSGTATGTQTNETDISDSNVVSESIDKSISGTESVERGVYGFNSSTSQDSDNANTTNSGTEDLDTSRTTQVTRSEDVSLSNSESVSSTKTNNLTDTETVDRGYERELRRTGNIGVTTSQQMLESELKLRTWNFFYSVFDDIDSICCLPIY